MGNNDVLYKFKLLGARFLFLILRSECIYGHHPDLNRSGSNVAKKLILYYLTKSLQLLVKEAPLDTFILLISQQLNYLENSLSLCWAHAKDSGYHSSP